MARYVTLRKVCYFVRHRKNNEDVCVGGKFACEVLKKIIYTEMQNSMQGIFNWLPVSQIGGFFYPQINSFLKFQNNFTVEF